MTATNADGPPATGRFIIDMNGDDLDVLSVALHAGSMHGHDD